MPAFNEHIKDIMEREQKEAQVPRAKLEKAIKKKEQLKKTVYDIEKKTFDEIRKTDVVVYYIKRKPAYGLMSEHRPYKTDYSFFPHLELKRTVTIDRVTWNQSVKSTANPSDGQLEEALLNYRNTQKQAELK